MISNKHLLYEQENMKVSKITFIETGKPVVNGCFAELKNETGLRKVEELGRRVCVCH